MLDALTLLLQRCHPLAKLAHLDDERFCFRMTRRLLQSADLRRNVVAPGTQRIDFRDEPAATLIQREHFVDGRDGDRVIAFGGDRRAPFLLLAHPRHRPPRRQVSEVEAAAASGDAATRLMRTSNNQRERFTMYVLRSSHSIM